MKYWLKVLFTPGCWIQNTAYSPLWDAQLRALLDSGEKFVVADSSGYTASIGDYVVWIENHPYASFTPYSGNSNRRPSRATILRAMDHLAEDALAAIKQPMCSKIGRKHNMWLERATDWEEDYWKEEY